LREWGEISKEKVIELLGMQKRERTVYRRKREIFDRKEKIRN
jgi:hypothetical protein